MPARKAEVPPEIRSARTENGIAVQGADQAADARNELREHRGDRRARIMHPEGEDEQKVQSDVEQGGENEEVERRPRIPHRAEHARHDVVKDGRGNPAENDEQIGIGVLVICGGRLHEIEQHPRQRNGDRRDDGGDKNAQKIAHAHGAPHAVFLTRAECLRHFDGETGRQPVHRPDDQKDDGARQPDARECLGPDRIAHDDGIRHVVELLEHAAQKDGQRKKKNELERTALGQILHAFCFVHDAPLAQSAPTGFFLACIICFSPEKASVLTKNNTDFFINFMTGPTRREKGVDNPLSAW